MSIKEIRENAGLTRKEFSEKLSIPYRTIQDWETSKREPTDYLEKLICMAMSEEAKKTTGGHFKRIGGVDLGGGYSTEEYINDNYKVTVNISGDVKIVTANPRFSYLPEIHLSDGQVTKIGFVGDVILEENLKKSAEALRNTESLIRILKNM